MTEQLTPETLARILADLRDLVAQRPADLEAFDLAAVACADADLGALEDEWREEGLPLRAFVAEDLAFRLEQFPRAMLADPEDDRTEAEARALGQAGEALAERLRAIAYAPTTATDPESN